MKPLLTVQPFYATRLAARRVALFVAGIAAAVVIGAFVLFGLVFGAGDTLLIAFLIARGIIG